MICSAQTREEDNKDSTKTAAVTSLFCHTNNTAARNVYKAKTFIASVKVGAEKEKSTGLSHLNGIFFSVKVQFYSWRYYSNRSDGMLTAQLELVSSLRQDLISLLLSAGEMSLLINL